MTTETMGYPVRIRGELKEPISRWLFLVKWLLLIPHWLVLALLAIVFLFSWIASLVAILFTRRYPRPLFDFNVGFLRWGWRVEFYGYSALGTDRYPPFSLKEDPDYPADLYVEYPGELSRLLALFKWWVLALPHYLVLGILRGGWGYNIGLLQALVLIMAVANLFTGEYRRGAWKDIWLLVMGINRWTYRVYGYVALATDTYPPFSLEE